MRHLTILLFFSSFVFAQTRLNKIVRHNTYSEDYEGLTSSITQIDTEIPYADTTSKNYKFINLSIRRVIKMSDYYNIIKMKKVKSVSENEERPAYFSIRYEECLNTDKFLWLVFFISESACCGGNFSSDNTYSLFIDLEKSLILSPEKVLKKNKLIDFKKTLKEYSQNGNLEVERFNFNKYSDFALLQNKVIVYNKLYGTHSNGSTSAEIPIEKVLPYFRDDIMTEIKNFR